MFWVGALFGVVIVGGCVVVFLEAYDRLTNLEASKKEEAADEELLNKEFKDNK